MDRQFGSAADTDGAQILTAPRSPTDSDDNPTTRRPRQGAPGEDANEARELARAFASVGMANVYLYTAPGSWPSTWTRPCSPGR